MINKIEIAGIQLDNEPVREILAELEQGMGSQVFHTVEEITMDMLLASRSDGQLQEALGMLDHALIAEAEVLEAAGVSDIQRKREIEGRDFFHGLMQLLARSGKKLFLLGDTVAATEQVYQYLGEKFPECAIVGVFAMEQCVGASEAVANEINAAAADVVLCVIKSPEREYFLLDNKDKISAALWYGADRESLLQKRSPLLKRIFKRMRKKKLADQITSVQHTGEKDEN